MQVPREGEAVQILLILDLGTRWGVSGERNVPVKGQPVPTA
jgi:hypothetical protein